VRDREEWEVLLDDDDFWDDRVCSFPCYVCGEEDDDEDEEVDE
jgi:hypothetical protein